MNKKPLIKVSLVAAAFAIALGATAPQKAAASQTGTLPIISTGTLPIISTGTLPIIAKPADSFKATVKDNGTLPIIAQPSSTDVNAGNGGFGGSSFTLTITVNNAPTQDTPITLSTNRSDVINLPSTVVVSAGTTSVTTTVTVNPGSSLHHSTVLLSASANGATVTTFVRVHYTGEQN